ncbi:hypothetical protein [Xanthomonas albilineans]|uniref:hypothetical protein n=1 Tax=Xanthomonas albilineans TaxID=29447 RepID=UPI000A8C3D12|nr:hypothetical protein [Xanthomonas albilineans]
METITSIAPCALPDVWRHAAEGKTVASFDCFDTLLWRGVSAPSQVFCELAGKPPFSTQGYTAYHRVMAESLARRVRFEQKEVPEVTLREVYQQLFPEPDDATRITACMACEQEAEASICFVVPAVIACMREARRLGMTIIVVSDTYFNAGQLRALIASVSPEADELVDRIFCSSDYRTMKKYQLWHRVLDELYAAPETIVHLGDNRVADILMPSKLGIACLWLDRYAGAAMTVLRRRECATRLIFSGVEETRSVWTLYDGLDCRTQAERSNWHDELGWHFLGPVVFAFAKTLADEFAGQTHGIDQPTVRFGFLMRDAHLLREAADIVAPHEPHPSLHISRKTAFSASFDSDDAILHFVKLGRLEYRLSAAQCGVCLLLNEVEKARLAEAFMAKEDTAGAMREFFSPQMLDAIKTRSKAFRARLIRHIVAQTGLKRGDTLCLVDTGYNGTIQYLLHDVLRKEMNVTVIGRYLIYRQNLRLHGRASGLIDESWLDHGLIHTLSQSGLSYLEALCAGAGGCVVDYAQNGRSVCNAEMVCRSPWIDACQRMALMFVNQVCASSASELPKLTRSRLRESALTNISAMLFFPSECELSEISQMQGEVNLGADICHSLCDPEKGLSGLRRRGLLYMTGGGEFRSNWPFELRYAGADQLALYMACFRNGLRMTEPAFSYRHITLPLTFAFEADVARRCVPAHATYDGYYTAVFPLSQGKVYVEIGAVAQWLQIESVTSFPAEAYGYISESSGPQLRFESTDYIFDDVTRHGNGLLECDHAAVMTFAPIPEGTSDYIRLVFRPITLRDDPQLTAWPADQQLVAVNGVDSHCGGKDKSAPIPSYAALIDAKLAAIGSVLNTAVYTGL